MLKETLVLTAIQSGILFLALWGIFRLAPAFPANAKAWIWRLAFLKPLLSLLPFAVVSLPILPREEQPVQVVSTDYGYALETVYIPAPEAPAPINIDPLLLLWGAGVIGVAAYAFIGMHKALRVTRSAQAVTDQRLLEAFDDLLTKANIHRKPRLLASRRVATPMLVGGRGYAIVLPQEAVAQNDFEDLRLMMAHEVAHIERQDLWWFGLVSTVQSLFFFNPMVWVAVRCFRLDHESATDRHASRLAGVPIQTYADMLLRATTTARPAFAPGALPMAESYRTIHRRLEAMKHFNSKPTFWRRTSTVALAILTMGMLPAYNLVAAAVPMDDPIPAQGQTARVAQTRQTQEEKEVKQLKARIARVQLEMQKKQAELDKLQRQIDKKSGAAAKSGDTFRIVKQGTPAGDIYIAKPAQGQATRNDVYIAKPAQGQATRNGVYIAKPAQGEAAGNPIYIAKPAQGEAAGNPIYIAKPAQGEAAGNPIYIAKPAQGQSKDPVKGNTIWKTPAGQEYPKYRVDWRTPEPGKGGTWHTYQVSPKYSVTWKVSEAQATGENGSTKWRIVDVPKQDGNTTYQITGKNLVIEQKGGVFYIKADGEISIKPIKVSNEAKTETIATPVETIRPSTSIQGTQHITTVNTTQGKADVQGTINTKPVNIQGGTAVFGTQNVKTVNTQGTAVFGVQSTVNTKNVTTTSGNYRVITTGKNPYNVTFGGKAKKETPKPKEKKRPSIDPLIFPPN